MKKELKKSILFSAVALSLNANAAFYATDGWYDARVPYKMSYGTGSPDDLSPEAYASFNSAVEYFNKTTDIKIIDVTHDPEFGPGSTMEWVNVWALPTSAGYAGLATGTCSLFCSFFTDPSLQLKPDAGPDTAIHEMIHVLGSSHEQQRYDRDNYIQVNPLISQTDSDYKRWGLDLLTSAQPATILGKYDHYSIMHYSDNVAYKYDNLATLSIAKEITPYDKQFRILAGDAVSNMFYDRSLNDETGGSYAVRKFNGGQASSLFDFKYNAADGTFYIRSLSQTGTYLSIDANGALKNVTALSQPGTKWRITPNGTRFNIENVTAGKYLTFVPAPSPSQDGVVKFETLPPTVGWVISLASAGSRDSNTRTLSQMDKLAVNYWNGVRSFRIRQVDATPNRIKNNSAFYLINGNNLAVGTVDLDWHSAQWSLEPVGDYYFRLKNVWQNTYLNDEFNQLGLSSKETVNSANVPLTSWASAMWSMEIKYGHFLIKNIGSGKYLSVNNNVPLLQGYEANAAKWLIEPVITRAVGTLGLPKVGTCLIPNAADSANPPDNVAIRASAKCRIDGFQTFEFTSKNSIKHKLSGKCLMPEGGAANPLAGTRVVVTSSCDSANQAFELNADGQLIHEVSGLCIQAQGLNADVSLQSCSSTSANQYFRLFERDAQLLVQYSSKACVTSASTTPVEREKPYFVAASGCSSNINAAFKLNVDGLLVHSASGRCLMPDTTTVPNKLAFGPVGCTVSSSSPSSDTKRFEVTPTGRIKHIATGLCVQPTGGTTSPANGTTLELVNSCDGTEATRVAPVSRYIRN